MADADVVRRVILGERQEQRVADQFHDDGGIVFVALNVIELEEVEADLIVYQLPIGGVFRVHCRRRRLFVESFAPVGVELALLGDGFQTEIVQLGIQSDRLPRLGV